MPRNGDGSSDNAIEAGHNIVHGAGQEQQSSHVDRADKVAQPPESEHGGAIPGMAASGGGSQGIANTGSGKGPLDKDIPTK